MREFEGLSYDEIGERTGMSRQMVESTLFRARRKLTEEYDELASGRRCEQVQAMIEDGRAVSARSIGIRERRRSTRHLAHCQPCRVPARLAGRRRDAGQAAQHRREDRRAASVPDLALALGRGGGKAAAGKGAAAKGAAHASGAGSLQSAAGVAAPAASSIGIGQAAATVAALAIAGAGGGVVSGLWTGHRAPPSRAAGAVTHSGAAAAARAHSRGARNRRRRTRRRRGVPRPCRRIARPRAQLVRVPGAPASHTARPAAPRRSPLRDRSGPGPSGGSASNGAGTFTERDGHRSRPRSPAPTGTVDKVVAGGESTVNKVVYGHDEHACSKVVSGATGTVNKVVRARHGQRRPAPRGQGPAGSRQRCQVRALAGRRTQRRHLRRTQTTSQPARKVASASVSDHGPATRGISRGGRRLRPADAASRCGILDRIGAWRSLVARTVRVGEVPGSNPGAPIETWSFAGIDGGWLGRDLIPMGSRYRGKAFRSLQLLAVKWLHGRVDMLAFSCTADEFAQSERFRRLGPPFPLARE